MKPPSPQSATHWRDGSITLAAIAAGRPAPIVARALSSSTVLGSRAGYARATWILYMPLSRQRIADGCSAREVGAEVRWRRRRRVGGGVVVAVWCVWWWRWRWRPCVQRAAEVLHHPLDIHGERRRRRVHAAVHLLLLHGLAPLEEGVVPVALRLALLFDLPQRVADVADDLGVREVDRVDLGRNERDVEDDGLRSGEDAGSEVVVVVRRRRWWWWWRWRWWWWRRWRPVTVWWSWVRW